MLSGQNDPSGMILRALKRLRIKGPMRKYFVILAILATLYGGWGQLKGINDHQAPSSSVNQTVTRAFEEQKSDVQVSGEGLVTKILPDDRDGSRHQLFILRLPSGRTLLISHNIDIAPRLDSLKPGDSVEFYGVYEWNSKGGLVHWTHRDPGGQHEGGWLRHNGQTFQ